jgi:hypothetical protein
LVSWRIDAYAGVSVKAYWKPWTGGMDVGAGRSAAARTGVSAEAGLALGRVAGCASRVVREVRVGGFLTWRRLVDCRVPNDREIDGPAV